jgi:hypothetical protein
MTTPTLADPTLDAGQKQEAKSLKVDDLLRDAVRDSMAAFEAAGTNYARIQELLERKAALMRAPFTEKVRRIKETA